MGNVRRKPYSVKQLVAAPLLANGVTYDDVARVLDVPKGTITSWMSDENYREMVATIAENVARWELQVAMVASGKAWKALMEALDSPSESVRLRAAELAFKRLDASMGALQQIAEREETRYYADPATKEILAKYKVKGEDGVDEQ